jgi:hypothetical protein
LQEYDFAVSLVFRVQRHIPAVFLPEERSPFLRVVLGGRLRRAGFQGLQGVCLRKRLFRAGDAGFGAGLQLPEAGVLLFDLPA